MRERGRNATGGQGDSAPALVRFSTEDLPEQDRAVYWRDVMGKTLTGCSPSSLDGGEMSVDFTLVGGRDVRLGITRLDSIRNNRDQDCLRDRDEDLIFFSMLSGEGQVDHYDHRIRLARGDGVLAKFDRTLDTSWPRADVMLIRLGRDAIRGVEPERAAGLLQPRSRTVMRLLQSYARTAWREATRSGALEPIAERHIAELVAALCVGNSEDQLKAAQPALRPARVSAMRELIARHHANPCLSMREVAAAAGLSERAGHLAFAVAEISFTEELHRIRLDRAQERLLAGRERIIDVAYGVGFSDLSHFHRLFKRRFGCTPGEWRSGEARH
jgi:AraC-like DNA-binding protein